MESPKNEWDNYYGAQFVERALHGVDLIFMQLDLHRG